LPSIDLIGHNQAMLECNARWTIRAAIAAGAFLLAFAPAASAQDAPAAEAPALAHAGAAVREATEGALRAAERLTASALGLIGIRYKWGGATPQSGLDCSGLVQFVFQQVTGVTLPRSAKEMSRLGEKVALSELKAGDLVFFDTRRFSFSHVGIYLGDNRFIHAPRRGREVEIATIDSSYWQKHFSGARRVIGVLPEMIPMVVGEAIAAPLFPEPMPAPATTALPSSAPLDSTPQP
jgi:cell wall-associated NlpC family hydrolase